MQKDRSLDNINPVKKDLHNQIDAKESSPGPNMFSPSPYKIAQKPQSHEKIRIFDQNYDLEIT